MLNLRSRMLSGLILVVLFSMAAVAQGPDVAALKAKAGSGEAGAQLSLARAYANGQGVSQNYEAAAKWFRAAAQQGSAEAQNELGLLYRLGRGVAEDKEQAVSWYRKAARQGYAPAMFNLATAYYNGDGVGISDSYAYSWFVLAERAGSKEAPDAVRRMQNNLTPVRLDGAKLLLSDMLYKGEEVAADPKLAFELMRQVADNHDRMAEFEVGRSYAAGKGVPQDTALAVKYLNESGTPEALAYLAGMYLEGRGVPRDASKGLELLTKIAAASNEVRLKLADLYWAGSLVPQNYKEAIKGYQWLADRGDAHALYMLGVAYRGGNGVGKNLETSCMYLVIAANAGSVEGNRDANSACTGQLLEKTKKKATDWLRGHPAASLAITNRLLKAQRVTVPAGPSQ